MAKTWTVERLATASGEPAERLEWYADAGLIHRVTDADFAADSLHRVRILGYARRRGITDEELALATKEQGDLLGVFDEFASEEPTDLTMQDAARKAGISDTMIREFQDILGINDNE